MRKHSFVPSFWWLEVCGTKVSVRFQIAKLLLTASIWPLSSEKVRSFINCLWNIKMSNPNLTCHEWIIGRNFTCWRIFRLLFQIRTSHYTPTWVVQPLRDHIVFYSPNIGYWYRLTAQLCCFSRWLGANVLCVSGRTANSPCRVCVLSPTRNSISRQRVLRPNSIPRRLDIRPRWCGL